MSIDGFDAGPDQSFENPIGVGGMTIFNWAFAARTFHKMHGSEGGGTGVDEDFAAAGFHNMGAWIPGRNMFGPPTLNRSGPWPDQKWRGWWGDTPPHHVPTFVLTHHPREPIPMPGGTTFHFVTDGIHAALERAREAAGGRNVRFGGGVSTIRQHLREGLIDEMTLALSPVLLGRGEELLAGLDLPKLEYECTGHVAGEKATHLVIARTIGRIS